MTKNLICLHEIVWGMPTLLMILGVGLYLSISTGFVQLRRFPHAFRLCFSGRHFDRKAEPQVTSWQAMLTALGASVGTGNLAGVAGAICIGGPGAVFWMWIGAFLGMATKFAEAVLAVRFRAAQDHCFVGGPMYVISLGMGKEWMPLAWMYSAFGILASFGIGNAVQCNSIIVALNTMHLPFPPFFIGVILGILVIAATLGGAHSIGKAAQSLVPASAGCYVLLCLLVLTLRASEIPHALSSIVTGAFCPRAVTGGAVGSAFTALRTGCSRGVFSNEAGLGTASIAHAGADVLHPAQQGEMGILEVFIDTLVICTMTALVILCSGVSVPYSMDAGAALTEKAFSSVLGAWAGAVLSFCLIVFSLTSIWGWGLYASRCFAFLLPEWLSLCYCMLQFSASVIGTCWNTGTIWMLSDLFNGLMAFPNLISLTVLAPVVRKLLHEYIQIGRLATCDINIEPGSISANGGTYANFNQCKPL